MKSSPRRRKKANPLRKAAELSLAAPQVVALRSMQMLAAGANPTVRDTRELTRMSSEKLQAFGESVNAAALQMMRVNQELAAFALRQWWSAWAAPWSAMAKAPAAPATAHRLVRDAVSSVLDEALKPVHTRATANARRLRKRR
jgi:hypothetical protein